MDSITLAKTAQNDCRDFGRPSSCHTFAIATFSCYKLYNIGYYNKLQICN